MSDSTNKSTRPVTIKEVAEKAGVSTAAVSYALRNTPGVSQKTRNMILKVAEELGYKRNPAFSALGAMAHQHVANRKGLPLVYVRQLDRHGKDIHHQERFDGMQAGCKRLGYHLESVILKTEADQKIFLRGLSNRGICGLLVGYLQDLSLLQQKPLSRVALVSAGWFHFEYNIHTVRASHFQSARHLLLEVYRRGYRKILVLQQNPQERSSAEDHARYGGILAAKAEIGTLPGGWMRLVQRPANDDLPAWKKILSLRKPDVVIGFEAADYSSIQNAVPPERRPLPFAAIEVPPGTRCGSAELSGMAITEFEAGKHCIEWLDQMIRLGEFGIPKTSHFMVLKPIWIEGTTLPHNVQ